MKTLIVEDDMMSQCVLAKVLTERGHEVVSYENAEQAILAYQKQFYPLLFVDVGLPGMDGLQFCKWMRAQPNGDKVFIMVATSSGQPDDMNQVLSVGANDFLPKPYDVGALGVRLTIAEHQMKEFFERKEIEDALRASQEDFHRVVSAANEGAWLLNAQFRTDYVNPQMAAIIGYQVEELTNRGVIDFLSESDRPDAEQLFQQLADGKEVKGEFRFRRKDGTECLALVSAAPMLSESGEFKGSLWMVADLTGAKNLEVELAEARKRFETQVRDLTAELNKSRKSLQTESAERKKVEQTLQQARADLEARLNELSTQRGKISDELRIEVASRQKIEGQLTKTRDELNARTQEFSAELNKANEALQAEVNRRKESEEALRKLRKELEVEIQRLRDELSGTAKELKSEQTANKQADEALQKARAEIDSRARHHAEEKTRIDQSLQAEIAERRRIAELLQKIQHESEAAARRHTEESTRADRALQAEIAERKRLAEALHKAQQDLETRAKQHAAELAESSKLIQAESTERKAADNALQKAQHDLEVLTRQHSEESARAEKALQAEIAERKRVAESLQRVQRDSEARVKEFESQLAKVSEELKNESGRRKGTEQELIKARGELAHRLKEHTTELLKMNEGFKSEIAVRRRVEEELLKSREEAARRVKDHMAEMVKASEELKAVLAERRKGEEASARSREAVETKLSERTGELNRVREELKTQTAERHRLEQNLARTREELETRLKERAADVDKLKQEINVIEDRSAKAANELRAERQKAEEALSRARGEAELRFNERASELTKVREELKGQTVERQKIEQTLAKTRDELEARLKERAGEVDRLNHELKVREEGLAKADGTLKDESTARQRAEEALENVRRELQARIGELSAQLDQAKQKLNEGAAQVGSISEDLKTRTGALDKAGEELKEATAARERAQIRSATFLKLGGELSAARTYNDAARVIAGVAQASLGWDACSVDLYSAEDDRISPVLNIDTVNGRPAEVAAIFSGPEPSPIMRRVLRDGAQLILRSGPSNSHTDYILFGDRARLSASLMYVAMRTGNAIVGFLSVQSYTPGAYNQEGLETLQALADHCGAAMERIQAEETRHRSEERFQLVTRATNDSVWDWSLETDRIWWNNAFQSMFGYKAEEIEPASEFRSSRIHPADRERVLSGLETAIKSGDDAWSDEYRFQRSDGSFAHVLDRGYVLRNEHKKPVRMIGAMADVSQRKQTEAAMIEGQARKGAILEAAIDAIVTIDHEGKVFEWNPAAERMFGYRRADVLGKDLAELIIPQSQRSRHRAGLTGLLGTGDDQGKTAGRRMELRAMRADGTEFPIEMTVTRIATDGPPIFTGFIRDLTEKLSLETQLRHAQKMESIGQLAAGVAHDFNNLLGVVQGYSTLLMEDKDVKPETADALKQIASATERAAHLTRQLLTFSRKQIIHVRTLDLNELINNVGKLLRRAIGEGVSLQFNYSPNLPPVEADTGMMEQVVMNLAINARDAMPQGGQLTIGTTAVEVEEDYAEHRPEARRGQFVCLTVSDTGCGMDEPTLDRIFEPFFTTKSSGKGTGLGLATVYGIVKQHRGWIEVQSQVGRGTEFKVFLPVSSRAIAPRTLDANKPAARGGTETILLVEDEPAVLAMAKGILQRLGYQVLTAASGDEALPVWQQNGATTDLLLTDMVMPGGLNGRELAEKLSREKPDLKVLYTSGYSMDLVGPGLATSKNFSFLQKPYHPEALAQTVRNCLDGKLP